MPRPPHPELPANADEAVRRDADERNARTLSRLAALSGLAAAGGALLFFLLGRPLPAAVLAADLALIVVLATGRDSPWYRQRVGPTAVAFLLLQCGVLAAALWGFDPGLRIALSSLGLPLLALLFRLRRREYLAFFAALWLLTVYVWQTETSGLWRAPGGLGGLVWPALASALFYAGAVSLADTRKRRFVDIWRRKSSRDRERARLREEIEDARQIQLSMLPRAAPEIAWLDIASVSLPASEVGGDYFDYFQLPGDRLAVVIGDVAGHGVASGLMLAALRSCLFLLHEELAAPVAVLDRLSGMVHNTAGRRMLVTLLCAAFDPAARTATLASAGHPPALHYRSAAGAVQPVELPAPPLGTLLPVTYRQTAVSLATGDAVVLYTDGLLEMADAAGEPYGQERLERSLVDAAGGRPAREMRNAMLADLANFKGDSRRLDDVTLIVVKVRA